MSDHHHSHGPANRGRVVHTTAAPLFVCGATGSPTAVVAVHGEPGIDHDFETGVRALAGAGAVVVAPYLYFRDGGPDYPHPDRARAAFARLDAGAVDVDLDAAVAHLTGRLGIAPSAVRVVGSGAGVPAARRAAARHGLPDAVAVDPAAGDPAARWTAARLLGPQTVP